MPPASILNYFYHNLSKYNIPLKKTNLIDNKCHLITYYYGLLILSLVKISF